jgi:acetyl esterase/lipase
MEEPVTKSAEIELNGELQGSLLLPVRENGVGVLVLAGSSGRVDVTRARVFAALNCTALALRWFGGAGQVPGICEIPLESFATAITRLVQQGCERIVLVGTSKGAEAALLTAIHDSRVDGVVAISPSSVVWGNIGPGRDGEEWPQRSSWTWGGDPLPFVASDPYWKREFRDGLLTYRGLFERSLRRFASEVDAATIPVEATQARIILVAGGDDALWPSELFARSIAARLAAVDKSAVLVFHPEAGHRVLLPSETTPRSTRHAHGGNDAADLALGRAAWDAIEALIGSLSR